MTDRASRIPLTEPFTAPERGRYRAEPDGEGTWHIHPCDDDQDGFPLDRGDTIAAVHVETHRFEIETQPPAPEPAPTDPVSRARARHACTPEGECEECSTRYDRVPWPCNTWLDLETDEERAQRIANHEADERARQQELLVKAYRTAIAEHGGAQRSQVIHGNRYVKAVVDLFVFLGRDTQQTAGALGIPHDAVLRALESDPFNVLKLPAPHVYGSFPTVDGAGVTVAEAQTGEARRARVDIQPGGLAWGLALHLGVKDAAALCDALGIWLDDAGRARAPESFDD